jgi:hypothetical protein
MLEQKTFTRNEDDRTPQDDQKVRSRRLLLKKAIVVGPVLVTLRARGAFAGDDDIPGGTVPYS